MNEAMGAVAATTRYSAAPFDLAAYERLCRDIDHDSRLIPNLRRSWERGRFWKHHLVGDQARLVHVPAANPMDMYRYYLFCCQGVCCEVSRRHETSEVIEVSLIAERHTALPGNFEAELLAAMAAFHREIQASGFDIVVPRIEWRQGTLNGRSRRLWSEPATGSSPQPEKSAARMNRGLQASPSRWLDRLWRTLRGYLLSTLLGVLVVLGCVLFKSWPALRDDALIRIWIFQIAISNLPILWQPRGKTYVPRAGAIAVFSIVLLPFYGVVLKGPLR